jgi:ABC-2 type transport system ATP-binding protein
MNQLPISISVEGLQKVFGTTTALNFVNLEFSSGVMHGVIGPEGAGKTTLMRLLLDLLKPTAGRIKFRRGGDLVNFEEIRASVAYMPGTQSLYPDLSIGEHLDFFKELYGVEEDVFQKRRKELLHITRLDAFIDRPAGKLSGGMYKKLGLMCALLRSPRVMLLDEPTNGVDPISRREFWELLYQLSDLKILILVTTSYMDEAERCSEVHLMEQGNVIAEGDPRQLLESEHVRSFDEFFLKRSEHGPGRL